MEAARSTEGRETRREVCSRQSVLAALFAPLLWAAFAAPTWAAEYFVNAAGNDANSGTGRDLAFLTIQKGIGALQPGDTLTIGPGEYPENVSVTGLGDLRKDTLIRAEIPGTVLLRGDRDADLDFRQVPGKRFVYVADCEWDVLSVMEADTLEILVPAADPVALEFGPGRFFRDPRLKKLYLSASDLQSPDRHRYRLAVRRGHGFDFGECKRVVLDGLAASGFMTPVDRAVLNYPVSAFMVRDCERCAVRRCVAFFNQSGITINDARSDGGNAIEACRAYGNGEGMVGFDPSGETFRDSDCFLNRDYGARFYGTRKGDRLCLFSRLVSWGNSGGDYWFKGKYLSDEEQYARAEQCVALRDCHIRALSHCIVGRSRRGSSDPATMDLPDGQEEFLEFADREFADALNFDFRPQATAASRMPGEGYDHKGPYPYGDDIHYVSPEGNDADDGLSMTQAWKTLDHAFGNLRSGDTLYIAGGRYGVATPLAVRSVRIRGRGMDAAIIEGPLTMNAARDVSFERLHLAGAVRIAGGGGISFEDCVFSGGEVEAHDVEGLTVTHGMLTTPLQLRNCTEVDLRGNLYASAPAVRADRMSAIRYSSYNSYPEAAACWEVARKVFSLSDLRRYRHDVYSEAIPPKLAHSGGSTVIENAWAFGGRGPLGTAVGPHREWRPLTMRLVGPFVHSVGSTTASIEWWTTLPAEVELAWGETPECASETQITQSSFYTHSLTGLRPGKKYYVKTHPERLFAAADPARRYRLPSGDPVAVEFTTAARASEPTTRYVSNDGDDANDGSTRATAWRTIQHAADQVRAGDTVLIAEGEYPGTVYFRATGEPGHPIAFRAIPGEKVTIDGMGEKLTAGFILFGKSHYRFDALYFDGFAGIPDNTAGAECGALLVQGGADLQVTRCHFSGGWGPAIPARDCPDILVRNCVFMHSMSSTSFQQCAGLRVENNVFVSPLIHHVRVSVSPGDSYSVNSNIFGENTRGKAHIPFTSVGRFQSNNCFFTRWPEEDRKLTEGPLIGGLTLPEYRIVVGETDSFVANPQFPGERGFCQGWGPRMPNKDFNGFFATNPTVVKRGIGLQPEAFRDFHFWKEDWPYDGDWAEQVLTRLGAADALARAGKDAQALTAYVRVAEETPMDDQLKADVLERAAQCANRLNDYEKAMELARRMTVPELSIRRQMAFMAERGKFAELIEAFADRPATGTPYLNWLVPDTERPLADALYYRATAYAETGNLQKAEEDMRTMVDKGKKLVYSPGAAILDLSWKRLGDFYRDRLKDDARALEAYAHVMDRMSVFHDDRPLHKSLLSGNSEVFAAATEAAQKILLRQGREDEARRLKLDLLKAQAEALAFLRELDEALDRFSRMLSIEGVFTAQHDAHKEHLRKLPAATRERALALIAEETPFARETRAFLLEAATGDDAGYAEVALRALLAFAPVGEVQAILTKVGE